MDGVREVKTTSGDMLYVVGNKAYTTREAAETAAWDAMTPLQRNAQLLRETGYGYAGRELYGR